MSSLELLALVLALALACTMAIAVRAQVRLARTRKELAELREELASRPRPVRAPTLARQATQVTTQALRTVVDTAARVREQGVSGFLTSSIEELTGIALANRSDIARSTGPDGTITVFFSDIVDSTALNEELGDEAWVKVLERHDKLVRKQVAAHRGHVVKSQGDGFMVVFADPGEAIATALGIQARLSTLAGGRRGVPVSVRMGMHVGTAIERDGDVFGRNVAMAARVAARADAERILVSAEVRERVGDDPFLDFVDPIDVELKGFPGTHTLWRAVARVD